MGWAKRRGQVVRAEAKRMASLLEGLKVALDVQHIYQVGAHAKDRGAIFHVAGGQRVVESDLSLHYAQAAMVALREMGADVLTNNPMTATLIGSYASRQAAAMVWGAHLYLACHVNAGRGGYSLCEVMAGHGTPGTDVALAIAKQVKTEFPAQVTKPVTAMLIPHERGAVCVQGFTSAPAVIVEPFFGDSEIHWPMMTLAGLERVGGAIARGVSQWWVMRARGAPPA